jgi:hypothetical protein
MKSPKAHFTCRADSESGQQGSILHAERTLKGGSKWLKGGRKTGAKGTMQHFTCRADSESGRCCLQDRCRRHHASWTLSMPKRGCNTGAEGTMLRAL